MSTPFKIIGEIRRPEPPKRNIVYLTRTSKVPDQVVDAVHSGIKFMLDVARSDLKIKDLRHWGTDANPTREYQSIDWYQSQTLIDLNHGFGRQVDSTNILSLAAFEPWQTAEPHLEAMIIDRDLNSQRADGQYINYLFAAARSGFGFVLSISRLGNIPNELMIKFAAHEFGHVLGLVGRDHNYLDQIGRHCGGEKGPCLMRQSLSLAILLRQHQEEVDANQAICPDCVRELQSLSTRATPSPL